MLLDGALSFVPPILWSETLFVMKATRGLKTTLPAEKVDGFFDEVFINYFIVVLKTINLCECASYICNQTPSKCLKKLN